MKIKLAVAAYFLFLALIVCLADSGHLYPLIPFFKSIPFGDKVGHFFLMGTFALLVNILLRARTFQALGRRWLLGSAIVFLIVFSEECSQLYFPGTRTFSLYDLSADALGIWLLGGLAGRLSKTSLRGAA